MDIDLWIKKEGDGSADKHLFCGYVELDTSAPRFLFLEYAGELRIIALKTNRLFCYTTGQPGTYTGYNSRVLYGKKDNLDPVEITI
jgi:hypothetical protein